MKKGELQKKANITASIMARLARNEIVRTDTINKICEALQCQPGEIMEYYEIDEIIDKDGNDLGARMIIKPHLFEEDEVIPISRNIIACSVVRQGLPYGVSAPKGRGLAP